MQRKNIRNSRQAELPGIVRRVILSWLLAVTIEYLILPTNLRDLGELDGLAAMSFSRVMITAGGLTVLLTGLSHFAKADRLERRGIPAVFGALAITALHDSFTWAFLGICLLLFGILVGFRIFGWDRSPETAVKPRKAEKSWLWITVGVSAAFFLFVSAWTVGRVYSFSAPTYDFGIFSQMFYYLKETGLPMTTVERDGLLSHFAVHVSPVYYLMLPFYWLFPVPAVLQALQAAVITSAVIPLWRIGGNRGLTGAQRLIACVILLLYPAFSGGTGYDIHENCFLTPLILWIFYGIDRKNIAITAVAALLTLSVKEDAAVYVAVIGLWLSVKTALRFKASEIRDLVTGIMLLTGALGWFFLVTGWLARSGDGVMTYRYSNFMYGGSSSLITVIKAVLMNPMKALYECVDGEKLQFIGETMLPLLGLPLLTRRCERYLLLIPYLLVNLMPDYQYQHDIFFQYSFGSTAFVMYLTVVNLSDFQKEGQRCAALVASALVSALCFGFLVVPKGLTCPVQAVRYHSYYQNIRDCLDRVPAGASVAATTFHTAHLSQREILYDIQYCSREHLLETDYVVLSLTAKSDYAKYATPGKENGLENLIRLLEKNGYTQYESLDDILVIYAKE